MKNFNRTWGAIAASAALGLAAMSSSASAQMTENEQFCHYVSFIICSQHRSLEFTEYPTFECTQAEFANCMAGFEAVAAKPSTIGDKRRDIQLASLTIEAARLL